MEEGKKENPPCDTSYGLKLRTQDPIAESRSRYELLSRTTWPACLFFLLYPLSLG